MKLYKMVTKNRVTQEEVLVDNVPEAVYFNFYCLEDFMYNMAMRHIGGKKNEDWLVKETRGSLVSIFIVSRKGDIKLLIK